MQKPGLMLSLNGTRVFEAAARLGSFKAAAAELGVTQSAVSHQVRKLEAGLGTQLFWRHHNGINLTSEGTRLLHSVSAALEMICRAQETIKTKGAQVTLRVSASLAYRWLIPRLPMLRRNYPRISVRLVTSPTPHCLDPDIDIVISYSRLGREASGATHLIADRAYLVGSPSMLTRADRQPGQLSIETVPLLSATVDDWEWHDWADAQGFSFADLRITDRFDIDHAALQACQAGLGVFLADAQMIEPELRSGALIRLGGYASVHLGDYWAHATSPSREPVRKVMTWLSELAANP